jgi:ribonuclease PH
MLYREQRFEAKVMSWQRPDGRQPAQLRPISFDLGFTHFATGSVLTKCGDTQVLCSVTIKTGVPKFWKEQARDG